MKQPSVIRRFGQIKGAQENGAVRVIRLFTCSLLLAFCVVMPAFGDALPYIEWDCGLAFIACTETIAIDSSQKVVTYIANGISIEVPLGNPKQPNAKNEFSFAFMVGVGDFGNVIDVPIGENIQTTSISNVQTYNDMGLFPGDKVLGFDTFYGKDALPQAYKTFLGSDTAVGYVLVTFKPKPVAEGSMNHIIDAVHIVINPVPIPEPNTAVLMSSGLLIAAVGRYLSLRRNRHY